MTRNATQFVLIALAFALVGAAHAAPPKDQAEARVEAAVAAAKAAAPKTPIDFATVDSNADGVVTPNEVQFVDDLRAVFASLDVNQDAKLTPAEFAGWERAGNVKDAMPLDPSTGPSGSSGAQHMPEQK